jgi:hypothetical protein
VPDQPDRPSGAPQPKAIYANYFEIGHNAFEFVIDFGQCYDREHIRHSVRIGTGPTYAKALLTLLSQSIARYEETYGVIEEIAPADNGAKRPDNERSRA